MYKQVPDYIIPLSKRGREQATATGKFLRSYYEELNRQLKEQWEELDDNARTAEPPVLKPKFWSSSYNRARTTAQLIHTEMGDLATKQVYEHVRFSKPTKLYFLIISLTISI